MTLAKQVVGGTSVIALAGMAARLLSFLTVPILSPILGPDSYGAAALVGTVVSFGSILALLGIDTAYARDYLLQDPARRPDIERFCWRFSAVGALLSAFLAGSGWLLLGDRWLAEHRLIAVYSCAAIVMSATASMATTRIRLSGNYFRLALALFASAVGSASICLAIALWWRPDAWALLFGTLAGSLTTLVTLGTPRGGALLRPSRLARSDRLAIVSLGLATSVTAPLYWLISSADRWFIAAYSDVGEAGIYSMAASIALLGQMLNSSITLTWFPEASRAYGEQGTTALAAVGSMWARLVVGLAVAWVAVSAAGGDLLRLLAAPAFHRGAQFIPWLAGGVFCYGLAGLANTSLFLAGRMRFAAYAWLSGGLLCLALNYLLVPWLGAYGAAMAQCLSFGSIALAVLVYAQRLLPLTIAWRRLVLALSLALAGGAIMVPAWAAHPLASLLCKLPFGVLLTAALLHVIAPDWLRRLLTTMRRAAFSGHG
jgi:O-antigen/teichoic acid export membrane protein